MIVQEVYVVDYRRRDGVAVAPLVATSPEHAAELVRVLMQPWCPIVESATVTRRPPMAGELTA
jgi:hypothetical protein